MDKGIDGRWMNIALNGECFKYLEFKITVNGGIETKMLEDQ